MSVLSVGMQIDSGMKLILIAWLDLEAKWTDAELMLTVNACVLYRIAAVLSECSKPVKLCILSHFAFRIMYSP